MQSFQFVIFILVISLFTASSHLFLGLPSDLVSAGDHSYTFFTMLLSGIRCTCPNQANLCALMSFMMFLLPVSLFSSSRCLLLTRYYLGDKVKNEMRGAHTMCGGEEKCIQGFGGEL